MKKFFKLIADLFRRIFGKKSKPKIVYIPINNIDEWSEEQKSIVNLINEYRESLGKSLVVPEKSGWEQAKLRVDYQINYHAESGEISHSQVGVAFKALKSLGFSGVAEILGYGYSSPESIVNAWKKSDGHNKVLKGNYKYVGIFHAKNSLGRNFYCGLFYY